VLVEPRPCHGERPPGAIDIVAFEARGEKPTDLCERAASVAGVAEEHPQRAEDLGDLPGVATIRPSEKQADSAEKRTHHLTKPVIQSGSQGVHAGGRGPGGRELAEEGIDPRDQGVSGAGARNGSEREERVLERASGIVRH
jgi:hypothetical protein